MSMSQLYQPALGSQYQSALLNQIAIQHNADMPTSRTLAETLTLLMARYGLSDNELARRTEVAQPTISRLRAGIRRHPRQPTIQPLADFFKVTPGQLRGEEPLNWETRKDGPSADAEVITYIDTRTLSQVLAGIREMWGYLPEDNNELARIISDGYTRTMLEVTGKHVRAALRESLKQHADTRRTGDGDNGHSGETGHA